MSEDCEDLADALDELEERVSDVEWVQDERLLEEFVPLLNQLDDVVAEQQATIERLRTRVSDLETRLQHFTGPEDGNDAPPEKRAADLRAMLTRRAETSPGAPPSMWWKQVRQRFVEQGYREYSKPVYFQAMEDAAEADGFRMTTKINENGDEVKAIGVNPDELPAQDGSSEVTTENSTQTASEMTSD